MIIKLLDEFKSLHPFESEELSDLTIITGKNGSGKSQLLSLLRDKADKNLVMTTRLSIKPQINTIQFEGLVKDNAMNISYQYWHGIVQSYYHQFSQIRPNSLEFIDFCKNSGFDIKQSAQKLFSEESSYKQLLGRVFGEINHSVAIPENKVDSSIQDYIIARLFSEQNRQLLLIINEIISKTRKPINKLTENDFLASSLSESFIDNNDLFSSRIEVIFYNYAKRRNQNRREYFDKKVDGIENDSLPDEDFIKRYPPPWSTINKTLLKLAIDFYFEEVPIRFVPEATLEIKLIKRSAGKAISFQDLSSGEKIIIGLIIKLFTSEYYADTLKFPDLMVFDEPDGPLHPEMSKLLIDVFIETFIKEYGIKVIFTTHSPSTIALAPENSIFKLTNGVETGLKKISKDEALKTLTSFVPTLSIDYNNHRQVFVESPTDVAYYQALYDRHAQISALSHKLYFIANSSGKGNCELVTAMVDAIRKSGNKTSFGIIDWDARNMNKEFILVHGMGKRYSIENFIFDPVYLITLLIRKNNAHGIIEAMGLKKSDNEYLIGMKSEKNLQIIIDRFFEKMSQAFPTKPAGNLIDSHYLNGTTVKLPQWFLHSKGHYLRGVIDKIFPALNHMSEINFTKALLEIMIKSYPYVPIESIELITELASSDNVG